MDHACTVPPDGPTAQCTNDHDCSAPTPHCDGEFVCVECTTSAQCIGASPVCDAERCRGCAKDSECDSEICDVSTGTCVDAATIAYASPTGSSVATCKKADPCSIDRAFTITDASRSNVLLTPGAYDANIVIQNKAVSVYATGATVTSSTGYTFEIDDRGSLRMTGGNVVSSAAPGAAIQCQTLDNIDSPKLSLSGTSIDGKDRGIYMLKCTATLTMAHVVGGSPVIAFGGSSVAIDRSSVIGGTTIAEDAGTVVRISNSVFSGSDNSSGALLAIDDSVAFVSFSTISGRLICTAGTPICTGSSPVGLCVDDSIVVDLAAGAPSDTITNGLCSVSSSIVYPQTTSLGNSGNKIGVDPKLKDPANGDYHLVTGSPAIDASAPGATDAFDFDGKARDAKPDLGAFEF